MKSPFSSILPMRPASLKAAVAMLCLALSLLSATAQRTRTTRPSLKLAEVAAVADTTLLQPGMVKFSGYEKTLRSRKETVLVTNADAPAFDQLLITIEYLDQRGSQLHKRQVALNFDSPVGPGETRIATFPSWDPHCAWYYYLSPPPTRAQATPYKVAITPTHSIKK